MDGLDICRKMPLSYNVGDLDGGKNVTFWVGRGKKGIGNCSVTYGHYLSIRWRDGELISRYDFYSPGGGVTLFNFITIVASLREKDLTSDQKRA